MLERQKLKRNMESKSSFRLNPKNPYVEVDSSDSNINALQEVKVRKYYY